MTEETLVVDCKKLQALSEEIMTAIGMLVKNENGPGKCDTQAIRMLLNVADELIELPRLQKALSEGQDVLCSGSHVEGTKIKE